jgi:F-type H+-transporting ATPase subunit gamma
MASERLIKSRIKSAKNISQITNAMQMVAASKMKRAQNAAISGRPYTEKIAQMTAAFVAKIDPGKHPLLNINSNGMRLFVLISTNKGLLGGLNTNLFRQLTKWYGADVLDNTVFATVGKKGEHFLVRTKKQLSVDFSDTLPFTNVIPALTKYITDGYLKQEFNEVTLIYNNFISALVQEPMQKKILPISQFSQSKENNEDVKNDKNSFEFIIEPGIDEILDQLLISYLENQVRDAVYEAEASEHSARMMAMKNATENALELIDLLTLEYNKARQEKITFEIADMITARMAVE